MVAASGYVSTADGAELWYGVTGEDRGRPAIVFADGLGCDGFAWKYLAPAFARDHLVLRFHYRGHGLSTVARDPKRLGVRYSADDLDLLFDHVAFPPAVLVGHSMGVQVILETHRRHPGRIRALVPLCGSYGHPLDTFHDSEALKRVFPYLLWAVERWPSPIAKVWRKVVPTELGVLVGRHVEANPHLLSRADFLPYLTHLAGLPPEVFGRTLADAQEHTAADHLPHVNVPTLVIGAEHDQFTPVRLSEHMAATVPLAELMVIPRATHSAPVEAPALIELRLRRFLRTRL